MAEIILSATSNLFNTGSINMDVSSDKIVGFVEKDSSVGKTQSGLYFLSAQEYIENFTEIKSLMVTSIWKLKSVATNTNAAKSNA